MELRPFHQDLRESSNSKVQEVEVRRTRKAIIVAVATASVGAVTASGEREAVAAAFSR